MYYNNDEEDNVYETEIRCENNEEGPSVQARVIPTGQQNVNNQTPSSKNVAWQQHMTTMRMDGTEKQRTGNVIRVAQIVLSVVLIIFLIVVTVLLSMIFKNSQEDNDNKGIPTTTAPQELTTTEAFPTSCNGLSKKGKFPSGIYQIQPEDGVDAFEVYCDMQTDGGGWTLVASVHESDINKKCDANDRWTNYIPSSAASTEKTSWANKRIFGKVQSCTDDDYKNSAYFNFKANNVMVWHVPDKTPVDDLKEKSVFRYRTTNNFLQMSGGNLKSFFEETYPLNIKSEYAILHDQIHEQRTRSVVDALVKKSNEIKSKIPDWYFYTFKSGAQQISDSGMYSSYGNKIGLYTDKGANNYMTYGRTFKYPGSEIVASTSVSEPFIMAAVIGNEDRLIDDFRTRVYSSTRRSTISATMGNIVKIGDFELQYRAIQFYSNTYSTICEYHFIIYNVNLWHSIKPISFDKVSQTANEAVYEINGYPSNVIMGYLLLTRTANEKVTTSQADDVAKILLQAMSTTRDLFIEFSHGQGLVAPIVFDKGNSEEMLQHIPPSYRISVEPGYLQFRAYNLSGFPNALCPGVKLQSLVADYVCVGGLSGFLGEYATCGDFAGWAGKEDDVIQNEVANGHAHSQNDISSTILIFYR